MVTLLHEMRIAKDYFRFLRSHQSFHCVCWVLFSDPSRATSSENGIVDFFKYPIINSFLLEDLRIIIVLFWPLRELFLALIIQGCNWQPRKCKINVVFIWKYLEEKVIAEFNWAQSIIPLWRCHSITHFCQKCADSRKKFLQLFDMHCERIIEWNSSNLQ